MFLHICLNGSSGSEKWSPPRGISDEFTVGSAHNVPIVAVSAHALGSDLEAFHANHDASLLR